MSTAIAPPPGVPAFHVTTMGPRRARWCCALFVIDEGDRLLSQLERMRPHAGACDVIIADGGSTDGSTAEAALRPRGVRACLVKTGPGRLSAQMRMAFWWALEEGYDGIIVMDGNDKDDPAALASFVAALEAGMDHVQGSRFVPGGHAINTPPARYLGIRFVHAPLISLAAGTRCTDTTNGFRAYSARLLLDPRVAPFRDVFSGYELHYYLAIRAARLGFRVREVPVTRAYPKRGPVPTKIRGWSGNWRVLRTLLAACTGRFDPGREA